MLLEQLIHDEEYPSCELLANCVGTDNLSQVCDTKGIENITPIVKISNR